MHHENSTTAATSQQRTSSSTRFGSITGSDIRTTIAASQPGWKCAAICIAAVAGLTTRRADVPIGVGLAVAILTAAALVDLRERRLPDVIVLTAALTLIIAVAVERAVAGFELDEVAIASGALAFAGPIVALHLVSPSSMGFGDVKAAAVLGAALGVVEWHLAPIALTLAAGTTAVAGLTTRTAMVPFGPGLVAAAALSLMLHPVLFPRSPFPPNRALSATHRPPEHARFSTKDMTSTLPVLAADCPRLQTGVASAHTPFCQHREHTQHAPEVDRLNPGDPAQTMQQQPTEVSFTTGGRRTPPCFSASGRRKAPHRSSRLPVKPIAENESTSRPTSPPNCPAWWPATTERAERTSKHGYCSRTVQLWGRT